MTKALTATEVEDVLKMRAFWKMQSGKFVREWTFKDFIHAMEFVNRVAAIAETAGHHPDIDIRYNRVVLGLVSHDAGGITERDVAMADQLDKEFEPN
jgi:4a-hydroxytetrahydrobiopterin dehydratase